MGGRYSLTCCLTLPLLMAGVVAEHHHAPVPTDDLALVTDLLDARLDLHSLAVPLLLVPVDDATAGQVVRRELNHDPVLGQDADVVLAHLAADVGENTVTVRELDAEHGVRQRLDDAALDLDGPFFLGHVLHISKRHCCLERVLAPGARETAQPTGRTGSLRRRGPAHQTAAQPDNLPPPAGRAATAEG